MLKPHQPPELAERNTGGALRELVGRGTGCYARWRATQRTRRRRPPPRPQPQEQVAPRRGPTQAVVVLGRLGPTSGVVVKKGEHVGHKQRTEAGKAGVGRLSLSK